MGPNPITVDFRLGDACVLFKDLVSFSNLGFCSLRLAKSGSTLVSTSHIPHLHYGQNTERGREERCSITAKVEWAWHIGWEKEEFKT